MVVSPPMPVLLYICLLFLGFLNVYHNPCVWPTALKLGCVTNLDTLSRDKVLWFMKFNFMLISSRHICMRSMIVIQVSNNFQCWSCNCSQLCLPDAQFGSVWRLTVIKVRNILILINFNMNPALNLSIRCNWHKTKPCVRLILVQILLSHGYLLVWMWFAQILVHNTGQ